MGIGRATRKAQGLDTFQASAALNRDKRTENRNHKEQREDTANETDLRIGGTESAPMENEAKECTCVVMGVQRGHIR